MADSERELAALECGRAALLVAVRQRCWRFIMTYSVSNPHNSYRGGCTIGHVSLESKSSLVRYR